MTGPAAHATFDGDWLALREALDHASRAPRVAAAAAAWLAARPGAKAIVDLGSGSGSNPRYLAPRLPGPQRWRLVDHDAGLLRAARRRCGALTDAENKPITLAGQVCDLGEHRALVPAAPGGALVTASALLDLVTGAWLERLLARCAGNRAALLFALSVDGRIDLSPGDRDDAIVRARVEAHQRRDKGFGAALGGRAPAVAARQLAAAGYRVVSAASDWRLGADDTALAGALVAGWRAAAIEQAPGQRARIAAWAERRSAALDARRLTIVVGHRDLFAAPPDRDHDGA